MYRRRRRQHPWRAIGQRPGLHSLQVRGRLGRRVRPTRAFGAGRGGGDACDPRRARARGGGDARDPRRARARGVRTDRSGRGARTHRARTARHRRPRDERDGAPGRSRPTPAPARTRGGQGGAPTRRASRPHRPRRDGPPARGDAQRRRRRRAASPAGPRCPRVAGRRRQRRRACGAPARRRRAGSAAAARRGGAGSAPARDRPLRLSNRPGGADQRAQARPRQPRRRDRPLPARRSRARSRRRRQGPRDNERTRPRPHRHPRTCQHLRRGDERRSRSSGRLHPQRPPSRRPLPAMSIRVLVADDQSMVRAGFRMLLSGEPDIEVVAEASNGLEAVDKAARFRPNVVLMDIRMPELDGLEASRRILAADDSARILILTTFDLDEYVYEALRAGASGFVLKDDPPEQLLAAIRTVAGGDALLSPAITRRVIEQFTRIPRPTSPPGLSELTERELDVFRLIARGLSNAEIGQELYISDTTVKTHITHILQKLDLRDRVQAVVLAYQTGFADGPVAPR